MVSRCPFRSLGQTVLFQTTSIVLCMTFLNLYLNFLNAFENNIGKKHLRKIQKVEMPYDAKGWLKNLKQVRLYEYVHNRKLEQPYVYME